MLCLLSYHSCESWRVKALRCRYCSGKLWRRLRLAHTSMLVQGINRASRKKAHSQPYLLTLLVTEEDCLKVNPMDAAYYLVRKYPATTEFSFDTLRPRQSEEVSRWIRNVLGSRAMLIRTLLGGAVPGFRKVAGVREISAEM